MNKTSVIIILLSCTVSIFSHLINQIDTLFFSLPMFYPSVDIFIRFGDLMILFGFLGLFLSTTKYPAMKLYSLLFSIFGLIRFLLIEFDMINPYGLAANSLMFFHIFMLILWILEINKIAVSSLVAKSRALIIITTIYFTFLLITSLISSDSINSSPAVILSILPFLIITYYIGFWIYFKEWYREAFIYKNPYLLDI